MEFQCDNGHFARTGSYRCGICGGRIVSVNGMSAQEYESKARERAKDTDWDEIYEVD